MLRIKVLIVGHRWCDSIVLANHHLWQCESDPIQYSANVL